LPPGAEEVPARLEAKTNGRAGPFLLKALANAPNRRAETLLGQVICKGGNKRLGEPLARPDAVRAFT
jgi:hypothetical protein